MAKSQRVVITGAHGSFGHHAHQYLTMQHPDWEIVALPRDQFDLSWSADQLTDTLTCLDPSIILNAAAFTHVDNAETQTELAYQVNEKGPEILAQWVSQDPSRYLVHISTDYVFDGSKGSAYKPQDTPNPINQYGASKLAGERAITATAPEQSAILRTSWLYGKRPQGFVWFIINGLKQGKTDLKVVDDQYGTPTWTGHLAVMSDWVMQERPTGIWHACNDGCVTRYEQACMIADTLGANPTEVFIKQPTDSFNFPAKRPVNTAMVSSFSSLDEPLLKAVQWDWAAAWYAFADNVLNTAQREPVLHRG